MPKEYQHYFKPVYYHEGKEDQLLQLVMERSEVIEEEIHLCGYFCIITSKKMTAKDALELEKIEMIRQTSGEYRLDHAVTATQKAILKAFKTDAACMQRYKTYCP